MIDRGRIEGLVADVLADVIEVRRQVHRHPELSGEEYRTTELVVSGLRDQGAFPRVRTPKTGLWVDFGNPGPMVAFRADLDALPIHEPAGLLYASEVPGVMHACGHDAHTAIGYGVALVMSRLESELPGRVRVMFQPAEETFPGGAYDLVREGIMEGVDSIIAFHVDPGLDSGKVGFKRGAITSSADRFFITLEGPGGHTARPHQTVDLVYATGQLITQIPALLDRLLDARAPVALVFGRVQAGTADNVIPTHGELSGTLRTADRAVWEEAPAILEQLARDIVAPLGAKVTFHYQRGIPPVVNDAGVVQTLERAAARVLSDDAIEGTFVSMGAEDFARYLDEAPGALMRLGCREDGSKVDLHSASFRLDESCLEVGVRVAVAGLLDMLDA
ncbi:MAG: amidohydrolase [Acidimicrobiia bacterium]|nr:amidohydrolase [Acidimicrobiia bacterium]MDH4306234.1 amidohydrolase [Acidimicrobiia bacterium]MDH5293200.1 amidohydrolase [Acidimicrobiia bacterium]